jgi:hypothetical protein
VGRGENLLILRKQKFLFSRPVRRFTTLNSKTRMVSGVSRRISE